MVQSFKRLQKLKFKNFAVLSQQMAKLKCVLQNECQKKVWKSLCLWINEMISYINLGEMNHWKEESEQQTYKERDESMW